MTAFGACIVAVMVAFTLAVCVAWVMLTTQEAGGSCDRYRDIVIRIKAHVAELSEVYYVCPMPWPMSTETVWHGMLGIWWESDLSHKPLPADANAYIK